MGDVEAVLLALVAEAGEGGSVAPEAVARAAAREGEDWRRLLPRVRASAVGLARRQRLVILRHGKPADPDSFKGVYRLAQPREA